MNQSSTPTRLSPSSHSSCCCGRDDCHARTRWQHDMHELKNDARRFADIAQELLKENQRLDQQLSEKTKQLQQVEARFERVYAKYKNLKHELKAKSVQVRDMQLFVQDTICEARTREAILRGKLKAAEGKLIVAEHKLKAAERTIAEDKQTNENQGAPFFMDSKPIGLSSHTNLPQPTQPQPSSTVIQQQPSSSKITSLGPALAAGSSNNDNKDHATKPTMTTWQHHQPPNHSKTNDGYHSAPSSRPMMKRSKMFVFKNIQPVNVWTAKVTTALQRLKATDLHSMKKRGSRPYDKAETSETSNSLIRSILFDIERLHTTEHPHILDICKALLQEIGELRTRLNDCF